MGLPSIWPPIGASCEGDDPATLNATPTGGTYSGTGVSGNTFDPSVAGGGLHVIQVFCHRFKQM